MTEPHWDTVQNYIPQQRVRLTGMSLAFCPFVLCLKPDDRGNKFIYPVLGDLSHSIALR
jgi:hypothetical protein